VQPSKFRKLNGICYSKEMQDQAAPPRFTGLYPFKKLIPIKYLPHDKSFSKLLRKLQRSGDLVQEGDCIYGNLPKLNLIIRDKEIKNLAAKDLVNFDKIDCQDIRCTCTDKPRYAQIFSDTTVDRDSILYNNCKRTIFAAAKRQIKSAPIPDEQVCNEFLNFAKQKIDQLIGDDLNSFGYSYNQWFNHLTRSKQKRMEKVHEYIHGTDPLNEHFTNVSSMDPSKLHYEAICKVEVQGTDGKPRMVCSIPDLIKYIMGPVTWKLEELFSEKIPCYCGGLNLTQMQDKINHYIDDGFVIAAEGDGSAFDNTQDFQLKELDRYIYNRILDKIHHVPKELFEYVANMIYKTMDVIHNTGKQRKTIMTYTVLGTVFSGDCDTTLMNTLRMGMYNWFTNYKLGLEFGKHFICFSKGDDFTVMYKLGVNLSKVKLGYDELWLKKPKFTGPAYEGLDDRIYGIGQILKFIEFGPPSSIKFCSLRAWYTNYHTQHIFLTRDPGKFTTLSKYSRKFLIMGKKDKARYLYDQALALITSYPGINYFQDMAAMYLRMAKTIDNENEVLKTYKNGKDIRITLPLEAEEQFDGYSYKPRKTCVKIVGSYWETMKSIETKQTSKLTPSCLELVNSQIDAEFSDRPISMLAGGL